MINDALNCVLDVGDKQMDFPSLIMLKMDLPKQQSGVLTFHPGSPRSRGQLSFLIVQRIVK